MARNDNTPTRNEELELRAGLLADDAAAWRTFHQRYDRLIHRCIRKVTHSFTAVLRYEDHQEIYANLMVQLLNNDKRKLRSFDPDRGSRLGTWLGLLATHAAYDYLRRMRREVPRVPLSEADGKSSEGVSPFEQVARRQRTHIVTRLIKRLSDKDREFVSLYFNRGLDAEQVASAMNISVKTVYSKKHKIRARLESFVAAAA